MTAMKNTRSEFHLEVFHGKSYKRLQLYSSYKGQTRDRPGTALKIFYFALNEISSKNPLR